MRFQSETFVFIPAGLGLGSISAALSCLRGVSAGSFPEQRLVIKPRLRQARAL